MKKHIIFCLTVLLLVSCGKKEAVLIPKDRFVEILADIHLADAYYSSHYEISKLHNDSANFYNTIIANHGFSKAQFDTTLKYYSTHSDEFDAIYENVVTMLNKTEQDNFQVRPIDPESVKNLWYGKNSWYLPKEGAQKKIPVDLKLSGKGKYIITFTYKVYPDDQSKNLRLNLYFANDSGKLKKDTLKTIRYKNDARTSIASVTKELKDSTLTHLKGYLLDHDEKKGNWKKHVVIEGLQVHYFPLE